jgi:hypothetical protein
LHIKTPEVIARQHKQGEKASYTTADTSAYIPARAILWLIGVSQRLFDFGKALFQRLYRPLQP